MRVKVTVSIGLVGCRQETEIEVEDDCSPNDIEEQARDALFEMIEWTWTKVENKHPRSRR